MTGWPDFPPASNATNGGWDEAPTGTTAGNSGTPSPSPASTKASRRMRLHTVTDVKRELRRIYIDTRNGSLKSADATKLAYILNMLANLMVDSDLEERVNAALEGSSK